MLYDKQFLKQLDAQKNKTILARVTSLTFDEQPQEVIQGKVTGGSINIDGASALRRTCSLTMIADKPNVNDYYWTLHTKFKLEIGVKNYVNKNYPDVIWFRQGIFVLTTFSCALSTNNFTVNLQGKDKMCLLNGEVGGSITAPTNFDSWEQELSDGTWVKEKYLLRNIIQDAVHQYAGEPYHNIIINDLDDVALQLLEYKYDDPMYLIRIAEKDEYRMATLNGDMQIGNKRLKDISKYDSLVNSLFDDGEGEKVGGYQVAKIQYGDTAGYRQTEMIYNDELIGNVGESITSILDKIKDMLGQFEYFYDLDGRFVFQKKQDFINTVWTPIVNRDGEIYVDSMIDNNGLAYTFTNSELITAFNNSPNIMNLRNDFSVWGSRKGAGDAEIPIHMRYAIDTKPVYYKSYDGKRIYTSDIVDWREIIFQMQEDYRKHHRENNFLATIASNNPDYYPNGFTGYEQYYIDIEGFWRQLYYPKSEQEIKVNRYTVKQIELNNELANAKINHQSKLVIDLEEQIKKVIKEKEDFIKDYNENYTASGWHKNVTEAPELLNYWIDFLDLEGELSQFSCKTIGSRPKSVNDSNVKAIYFRDTPGIIFGTNSELYALPQKTGYKYFQSSSMDSMFSVSAQGISAKEKLDELLYQHSYCIESVNLTTIPIYYLEPNVRIHVEDQSRGINGDYIVSKITIPLTYNGTMQLTTTRAASVRVF